MTRAFLLPVLLLVSAGCKTGPIFVHGQFHQHAPRRVAVMPPSNETNMVVGAQLCHILMADHVGSRGYAAVPAQQTIAFLSSKGITDGGQLGIWADTRWNFRQDLPAAKLCEDLKVDGLLMGKVAKFKTVITGFYNERTVTVAWMLVAKDGTTLWVDEKTGSHMDVQTSARGAAEAAAVQAITRVAENLADTPLYAEALEATQRCLATLPWPGRS